MRRLLVGVGTGEEVALAPHPADEDQVERRAGGVGARRQRHPRQAGDVDLADRGLQERTGPVQRRQLGPHLREDQGIEPLLRHHPVEQREIGLAGGEEVGEVGRTRRVGEAGGELAQVGDRMQHAARREGILGLGGLGKGGEAADRHVRPHPLQVELEVVGRRFEAAGVEIDEARRRLGDGGEARAGERVGDERGAGGLEFLLRTGVEGGRLLRERQVAPAGPVEAEALARQRAGFEAGGIASGWALADPGHGFGVGGGVAGERVEGERGVAHAAGDRPDHVTGAAGQRHHTGIRHEAEARLDADQPLRRGRVLDRAAGLLGQPQHGEARGHRRGGAGAGAAGNAIGRGRVEGGAGPGIVGVAAGMAQHRHVGLAEDDAAGLAHPRRHRRVGRRDQVDAAGLGAEEVPAAGARQAGHVHRVLDDDGHPRERPQLLARRPAGIDGAGIVECLRIHHDERLVARVVGLDPRQEGLCQRLGGDAALGKGALAVLDRHLDQLRRQRILGHLEGDGDGKGHCIHLDLALRILEDGETGPIPLEPLTGVVRAGACAGTRVLAVAGPRGRREASGKAHATKATNPSWPRPPGIASDSNRGLSAGRIRSSDGATAPSAVRPDLRLDLRSGLLRGGHLRNAASVNRPLSVERPPL